MPLALRVSTSFFSAIATCALVACGGAAKPASGPTTPTAATTTPDQQARGAQVYAESCAKCHGEHGDAHYGTPGVIGASTLPLEAPPSADDRKGKQFRTAQDVFAFTKEFMPDHQGGSLTDAQYWDVTAYMLTARGVALDGKTLDATNGASIIVNR